MRRSAWLRAAYALIVVHPSRLAEDGSHLRMTETAFRSTQDKLGSLLPLPRYHPLIRRLQPFTDARPRFLAPLHAQMRLAQFVCKFGPHFWAAFAEQLGADAEFFADGEIFESPARHLRQNRQQFDALFGQRIDSLLLVAGVVGPCDDALLEQRLQPIGEDVGGNAFLGFGQELAKMPTIAEHHVADDQEAPFVADHFEREIDRAARALCLVHKRCPNMRRKRHEEPLAISHQLSQNKTSCKTQSVKEAVCRLRCISTPWRRFAGRR